MLTRLRMKNFRSFKEDTIIDFTKTNYKILSDINLSNGIVKGGIFVGANASGKTSIIKSINKLIRLLFAQEQGEFNKDFCIFSKEPNMILEYSFNIDNSKIDYYIEYNRKSKILIEKLLLDEKALINRIGNNGESNITENRMFEDLDSESLLLREIYFNTKFRGYEILKEWFEFLMNSIYIDAFDQQIYSPSKKKLILKDYLEESGVEEINKFFKSLNFEQQIEYSNECCGNIVKITMEDEKGIFFKRRGVGEPIPYILESLGNRNLLNLLPAVFHVINNNGMLVIDEFSSGFHNKLEELLVKFFMNNSNQSQMFLVSHSTNLLSNSILRPDQIYLTEFKENGSSVKRASEERPREAQNIEKMYLSGVFGGVPNYIDEKSNI
ncbi:AAA family ATPase [Clostridium botulinum]|uniref:AAA family ATPase n=1 Tax=Clostridium botulinum TaxID=1491 RepID=UPI002246B017|nr:AAA family ATPase [Clostridium botulinum]UZP02617.1 AAA family ATPase [Clostridium botulinum]UZP05975.1 AAA family ATPase [Clostridium botulinum]UZP09356.1 AAA family ATPase [Clostridium botulinum]